MNKHVDQGNNPIEVAKLIYELINTKHPKVHYKIGVWLQKFSIFLKKLLPDLIYEKILMTFYKI